MSLDSAEAKLRTRSTFVALCDKLDITNGELDLIETALIVTYLDGKCDGLRESASILRDNQLTL